MDARRLNGAFQEGLLRCLSYSPTRDSSRQTHLRSSGFLEAHAIRFMSLLFCSIATKIGAESGDLRGYVLRQLVYIRCSQIAVLLLFFSAVQKIKLKNTYNKN